MAAPLPTLTVGNYTFAVTDCAVCGGVGLEAVGGTGVRLVNTEAGQPLVAAGGDLTVMIEITANIGTLTSITSIVTGDAGASFGGNVFVPAVDPPYVVAVPGQLDESNPTLGFDPTTMVAIEFDINAVGGEVMRLLITTSAVPAPAPLLLLLVGLAGLAAARGQRPRTRLA
ncbi:hypothetical protein JYK14_22725 [Siccirubricoccus sp. KC 17139]|uniref:PEP-CTERM sorting domain-containing protein n=1 Tax=Siccirubricoccus soli TaxID=2899147 RepID=A0ABT1DAJ9_9PROT|nr:hypothetical protein [Siccirubricoccus soli]MCO6418951.1 hypothetical protein [Siccirubricoccus soli]MCP2685086.1 hypothetical protein [Siccirubricoccus soli]